VKTTATVSVPVDPQTAFVVFTEEIDLWYVRGPISYFDFARAVGMRCEPGVGGRLVEVYDEATGEGLELARITVWEPGRRLAWSSSIDDVQTEIRFRPAGDGTEVTVEATIPEGGRDQGGSAWVRIVPRWLAGWCERRTTAERPQRDLGRLAVGLSYADPVAAAHWLADVFGLSSYDPLPVPGADDGRPLWIEFRVGDSSVILQRADGGPASGAAATGQETWVYVNDLDSHFAQAKAGGARIAEDITQHGFRAYTADDLAGHRWRFVQAGPRQR
jgi:uncharacterized glyoxalase superfamily protein PhnB